MEKGLNLEIYSIYLYLSLNNEVKGNQFISQYSQAYYWKDLKILLYAFKKYNLHYLNSYFKVVIIICFSKYLHQSNLTVN